VGRQLESHIAHVNADELGAWAADVSWLSMARACYGEQSRGMVTSPLDHDMAWAALPVFIQLLLLQAQA